MLVNYQSVQLVYEDIKFIFAFDLVMLLIEYLRLNLLLSDLPSGWKYEDDSYQYDDGLTLIVD